eukprot:UN21529
MSNMLIIMMHGFILSQILDYLRDNTIQFESWVFDIFSINIHV